MVEASPTEVAPDPGTARPLDVLVEGWRGINHSIGLVNQYQLLELSGMPQLRLSHRDMPFAYPAWSRTANPSGFDPRLQDLVDAIPEPDGRVPDWVYRITSPFRFDQSVRAARTLTFMITELGLERASFADAVGDVRAFTDADNRIQTSTRWSRDRIVDWGFPDNRIDVVPLGVDVSRFAPGSAADRDEARRQLGISDRETLFFCVGAAFWNKGVDLLLRAFVFLRGQGRDVRLMLKDQRELYGRGAEQVIREIACRDPGSITESALAAIEILPANLPVELLRVLYCAADCYVSPYRAEGFNLPVLEAIACGTPVIVTGGGATDDFCHGDLGTLLPGTSVAITDEKRGLVGRYIEPDYGTLIDAMDAVTRDCLVDGARFANRRLDVLRKFSWRRTAKEIVAIFRAGR